VQTDKVPIFDKNGNPAGLVAFAQDITERKETEESLRLSEEKHRVISSITADCVFSCVKADKEDFVIDWIVGATEKIFGYSPKEIIDEGSWEFTVQPQDLRTFKGKVNGLEPGQSSVCELRINHKDGSTRWIKVTSKVTKDSSNPTNHRLFGACRDIAERKKSENALKKSEQKYREFADSLPEIAFESDETGKLTFANRKGLEILGYSNDEIKLMNIFQFIVPEERQKALENFQKRMQGERSAGNEYTLLKKDGSKFPGLVYTKQIVNPDGNHELSGIIVNITETKSATKKLTALNEKLRVVGSLARHDVRNKLSAVEGNVHLARKKLPAESDALTYLSRIESTIDQITEIFNFAAAYERIGLEKLVYVDVEKAVEEAVRLLSDLQSVKISNNLHGLSVLADSLLNQLFFNLIDNSLKHGKQTSQIRIYYQKENGCNLRLVYEDDGVGIPYAEKPKLFKEGYSTDGGSGYGLHLIKKLTEVYGWTIQETGEPGKGAQFTITIPEKNQDNEKSYQLLST
jgi:PAS domain S-box-containing protein